MSDNIYPGTSVEIIDGQLLTPISIPADSTLILDVAVKGPTNRLYFVQNAKDAAAVYGATSPLIKQAQRSFDSGTKNILLYRVGGNVASIENLFEAGAGISTAVAAAGADFGLSVYIGPEPLNPALDCVIVTQGSKVVYSNTLSAPVDLGVVSLDAFNKSTNTVAVGSYKTPVPFNLVAANAGVSSTVTETGASVVTLPSGYVTANISTYGNFVTRTVTVGSVTTTTVIDPSLYVIDGTAKTLTLDGSITVGLTDVIAYTYVTKYTSIQLTANGLVYVSGEDLIGASYKKLYEAFDQALINLELVNAKITVVGDLFNVPNVANGDIATNRLDYLVITQDDNGDNVYTWSADKILYQKGSGTTVDVNQADLTGNGLPIINTLFNEVDFTHRLGMWAYDKTGEGVFVNCVIGAQGPTIYTRKYIDQWIGTQPTRDLDGNIVLNGSGLLGHRLMVGTTTYGGGYFATDTGFVDGTVLTDSGQSVVDLGKYLSVVITQVSSSNSSIGGVISSGAPYYAGVVSTITPGDSATNKIVPGVYIATALKAVKLKQLSGAGYVVFDNEPKGATIVSGNLASRKASDYQYIGTSVVVSQIVADLKAVGDPFVGRGIDGVSLVALLTALHKQMMARQTAGFFVSYSLQMQQVGPHEIQVAFVITAKDELRLISSTVKLARQIFSTPTTSGSTSN